VDPPGDRLPRAVIDTCVFGHLQQWISPLIDAARNGDAELLWSPTIIAETHRLLTWRWLRRHGADLSRRSWDSCSDQAKAFWRWVRPAFSVVDDRPPDEHLWTDRPRDEWDIPLWNAAVRGGAGFIVTENLRDGPPPDTEGVRRHAGITFINPDDFLALIAEDVDRHTMLDSPVKSAHRAGQPYMMLPDAPTLQ
jgi:hypothetical protein